MRLPGVPSRIALGLAAGLAAAGCSTAASGGSPVAVAPGAASVAPTSPAAATTPAAPAGTSCGPTTVATYNPHDTSVGAIAPARTGKKSGSPNAAGVMKALEARGIQDSGYIVQRIAAAISSSGKRGVLCPNGDLYVQGRSTPVLTGVGLITRSSGGERIPVSLSEGLYWHPAAEVLGSRPCFMFIFVAGPATESACSSNLDPGAQRP
jgi:hypothetical protein